MQYNQAKLIAVLFALLWQAPLLVNAMTIEVQGNQVFATGPVQDDLRKFEEAFAKPGVDTVVFVNSPGGDLWTGLRVGGLIADKGYKTVIAGSCVSACSIMFMGGKQRQFSDAFRPNQTFIGIHGAHNSETKQVIATLQPQIFAFYKLHMTDKFNAAVMNQALYQMEDSGSLLRVFDPVRSNKTATYHCVSSQTPRDKCSKLPEADAVNLGILTNAEFVKVNLPATFQARQLVFGREPVVDVADMPSFLSEIAEASYLLPTCKENVKNFSGRQENRAIATAVDAKGLGISNNSDSAAVAATRAIYNCNHPASGPARLCEVRLVNGFDLSGHYKESDLLHAKALTNLKPPIEKFYANEEFGGGFTQAQGIRKEKLIDITPQSIDGVKTINTQEVAKLLITEQRLSLIDVAGFHDTIPGAKALLGAGVAYDNIQTDEAFQKRLSGLLQAISPDKSQPIAFFCLNRNCWLAVNAALRAKSFGYTQVLWYRGGVESWRAASLPLVPGSVRATAF